jgi:deoxyribonuclease-4
MLHKFGAHLSKEGDFTKPLKSIVEKGGNCLQIFASSPRIWSQATVSDSQILAFKKEKERLGVDPVYFHASYLVNLADNGRVGHLSKQSLISELILAQKMGVRGSIVHLGSFKKQITENKQSRLSGIHDAVIPNKSETSSGHITKKPQLALELFQTEDSALSPDSASDSFQVLIDNIAEVLKQTPPSTFFMIENAGNRKIGLRLEEIGNIIKAIKSDRLRVCLDTCHLHAAGYDLTTESSLESFLNTFNTAIGLDRLELFHINDSRDDFESFRDRHENLGQGKISESVFKLILNHQRLSYLPFIIETPGFENTGPDKKNLDILKSFLS